MRRRPLPRDVTVKDRVGRTRYVAFRIEAGDGAPVGRGALSGALPPAAKLTRFDGRFGIVRTTQRDRDATVSVLNSLQRLGTREVRVETLATSGTIRAAARALPATSEASRRTPQRRGGEPPRRA